LTGELCYKAPYEISPYADASRYRESVIILLESKTLPCEMKSDVGIAIKQ
jgi:hypothetical protein